MRPCGRYRYRRAPPLLTKGHAGDYYPDMATEHLIKKYANRRLYDTTQSSHVTVDDLFAMILAGDTIRVIDDKSGDDITRSVLLQVINERESNSGQPLLSTALLQNLIRFYGNPLQGYFSRFLEDSATRFIAEQGRVQAEVEAFMQNMPMGEFGRVAQANLESWQKLQQEMLAALHGDPHRDEDDTG